MVTDLIAKYGAEVLKNNSPKRIFVDEEIFNLKYNSWICKVLTIDEPLVEDLYLINDKLYRVLAFVTHHVNNKINHYEIDLQSLFDFSVNKSNRYLQIYDKSLNYKQCKLKNDVNGVDEVQQYQITTLQPYEQLRNNDNIDMFPTHKITIPYQETYSNQMLSIDDIYYKVMKTVNLHNLNMYVTLYCKVIGDIDNEL